MKIRESWIVFFRTRQVLRRVIIVSVIVVTTFLLATKCANNENPVWPPSPNQYPSPLLYDSTPDWSPDGNWILYRHSMPGVSDSSGIYMIRPDGSGRQFVLKDGINPNWSPNSTQFVANSTNDSQIYIVDPFSSQVYTLAADPNVRLFPSWHPSGTDVIYSIRVAPDNIAGIWTHNILNDEKSRLFQTGGFDPEWDCTGSNIVFIRADRNLSIWNSTSDSIIDILNARDIGAGILRYPSFNTDGSMIVFLSPFTSNQPPSIWRYNIQTKQTFRIIQGGYDPSWSPDGQKIVFARPRSYKDMWEGDGYLWVFDIQSQELRQLTGQ